MAVGARPATPRARITALHDRVPAHPTVTPVAARVWTEPAGTIPSLSATPMNAHLRAPGNESFVIAQQKRTPTGRTYTQPEDVTGAAVFLVTSDSDWGHGALLMVDDGWSRRRRHASRATKGAGWCRRPLLQAPRSPVSGGLGSPIHVVMRKPVQKRIGLLLFGQRLLQQRHHILLAAELRPGYE
jgi:hypothetical protein